MEVTYTYIKYSISHTYIHSHILNATLYVVYIFRYFSEIWEGVGRDIRGKIDMKACNNRKPRLLILS